MQKKLPQIDFVLLALFGLISLIGFVFVYSSSFEISYKYLGNPNALFYRHLITYVVGLGIIIFFAKIKLYWLFRFYLGWFLIAFFFLCLVYVPGVSREVSGAKRWINLGNVIKMQPSEVAKFFVLIYLARALSLKRKKLSSFFAGTLPTVLLMGFIFILILFEPDISTSFLLGLVTFTLYYIVGVPSLYLWFLVCLAFTFLVYFLQYNPYWVSRFVFFAPTIDPFGKGYHLLQSLSCFQKGGFFGLGAGAFIKESIRLPDAHTDFIFSVIGQEIGLLGCLLVISLFILFVYHIVRIAKKQVYLECYLLAFGIGILLAYEVLIHIFVTIGLVPTTGLPLPFISFGRTSLISHMAMVGLLFNLSAYNQQDLTLTPIEE